MPLNASFRRRALTLIACLLLFRPFGFSQGGSIQRGPARFTVLSPRMVRIQLDPDGGEDGITPDGTVPKVEHTEGTTVISTSVFSLTYRDGSLFSPADRSPDNLHITFMLGTHKVIWYPGKPDAMNLLAPTRDLDQCEGESWRAKMPEGCFSRSGWALIDYHQNGKYDWIFLAHAYDIDSTLLDIARIHGRQGIPPFQALGNTYLSALRKNQTSKIDSLFTESESHDIPLDLLLTTDSTGFYRMGPKPEETVRRWDLHLSGATWAKWGTLAWLPFFTSSGANNGMPWWGHETGGSIQVADQDEELFAKWFMLSCFMPITLSKEPEMKHVQRHLWNYPAHFSSLQQRLYARRALLPYLYTSAFLTYSKGFPLVRPLWHFWPKWNDAYKYEDQYMWGASVLVVPLRTPSDEEGLTKRAFWLPPGEWFDESRQQSLKGGSPQIGEYEAGEYPVFYRAGSMLPMLTAYRAQKPWDSLPEMLDTLVLRIIPGEEGEGSLYEDDGWSMNYTKGEWATTRFQMQRTGARLSTTIGPRQGSYPGMRENRVWILRYEGIEKKPRRVKLGEKYLSDYWYFEDEQILMVELPLTSCDQAMTIEVEWTP